ncbi:hypothetical protein [Microbacterium gubbeenense]|uniref:hypothetical protein n=1 Tax=Microbacterium gubbeenense TaxID=159896 RepID=UPI00048AC667|nr:hypothetical protein [Microbacterium gubbeenense]
MSNSITLVSRVRLSFWVRFMLGGGFAAIAIVATVGTVNNLPIEPLVGVIVSLAVVASVVLAMTAAVAACVVTVDQRGVTLAFWVLYRTRIVASEIAELRADTWNSWDFGGYGIKGDRPSGKRGLLLNATVDGTGNGDVGILLRATDGRTFRVEVPDPHEFVRHADDLLARERI